MLGFQRKRAVILLVVVLALISLSIFVGSEDIKPEIRATQVLPTKVAPGMTMKVIADISDPSGVGSVHALMPFDGGMDRITLSLAKGTNHSGIWEGDWIVHDTSLTEYLTTIQATNMMGDTSTSYIVWSISSPPMDAAASLARACPAPGRPTSPPARSISFAWATRPRSASRS